MARKRVAILISGRGSNMAALIEAAKDPDYPAEIALVVSNEPDAAGLARAPTAGIATAVVDHRPSARIARRSSARCRRAAGAQDRDRLPRRLHAAADAVVRAGNGKAGC
jgi:phosphoribosylglycinamide formyltransferase 1